MQNGSIAAIVRVVWAEIKRFATFPLDKLGMPLPACRLLTADCYSTRQQPTMWSSIMPTACIKA